MLLLLLQLLPRAVHPKLNPVAVPLGLHQTAALLADLADHQNVAAAAVAAAAAAAAAVPFAQGAAALQVGRTAAAAVVCSQAGLEASRTAGRHTPGNQAGWHCELAAGQCGAAGAAGTGSCRTTAAAHGQTVSVFKTATTAAHSSTCCKTNTILLRHARCEFVANVLRSSCAERLQPYKAAAGAVWYLQRPQAEP